MPGPADRLPNAALVGRPGSRQDLATPALVLDLDVLDANIASMASHARAHGYALRPPAKIHKSVEIAHRQVAAGAAGLCCATLAEAMVAGGIPGVLLFSTVVTPAKIARVAALATRAPDFSVAVDDEDNVAALAAAARRAGATLRLLVDYEVGGGRTGVADEELAVALARRIARTEGVEFKGVQGYVGANQAVVDYDERRRAMRRDLASLARLVERLRAESLAPEVVTGGGTGSHEIDAAEGILNEIQAGTYVFMDVNYLDVVMREDNPHPFSPSLFVRTTVIGAAQPGFVVTDAGAKELDGMHGPLAPRIASGAPPGARYSLVGDDLGRIDFASPADGLAVGEVVEVIPPHCYQTAVMYPVYHCVRGDTLVDIWPLEALVNS